MDGENHGKNRIKMDDLGGKPTIFGKHPFTRFYTWQVGVWDF